MQILSVCNGRNERRYLVGDHRIIDQLSLSVSDKLAIVVGRESNNQVRI